MGQRHECKQVVPTITSVLPRPVDRSRMACPCGTIARKDIVELLFNLYDRMSELDRESLARGLAHELQTLSSAGGRVIAGSIAKSGLRGKRLWC